MWSGGLCGCGFGKLRACVASGVGGGVRSQSAKCSERQDSRAGLIPSAWMCDLGSQWEMRKTVWERVWQEEEARRELARPRAAARRLRSPTA